MKFVLRAVLLAIVLSSAAECKSVKSNRPSGHCLNLCTGVWRACMTSCDHLIHCMECTLNATECREKCLPRGSRQWRGSEMKLLVLYTLLLNCIRLKNYHSLATLYVTMCSPVAYALWNFYCELLLVGSFFNFCRVRKNGKEPICMFSR